MSSLPWPTFWEHIPEQDRPAISDILTELLATGVLLGREGRGRSLYLLARDYEKELAEYLAPLHLDLVTDPEAQIMQVRPEPGECGLTARFNKAETLVILTLWRLYDEVRMSQVTEIVTTTAQELFEKLKLFFENIEPPTESQLEKILRRLRRLKLIALPPASEAGRFADWPIEILPSLPRVIPFENAEAWEQQANLYRSGPSEEPNEEEEAG